MKIKDGFMLRKVGKDYTAVAIGSAAESFSGMIRINAAGEYLWQEMKQEISEDELVAKMLKRYEDLDEETARKDLREFVETIRVALE